MGSLELRIYLTANNGGRGPTGLRLWRRSVVDDGILDLAGQRNGRRDGGTTHLPLDSVQYYYTTTETKGVSL
jgi:hypothetical protein